MTTQLQEVLAKFGLPDVCVARLQNLQIANCRDMLTVSEFSLMSALDLSYSDVNRVLEEASRHVLPALPTTVLELHLQHGHGNPCMSTSIHGLDALLKGGLHGGLITEIVGPSGVGKTQFCTTLAVVASAPVAHGGLGGGVIYIDTETTFSADRMLELARNRYPHLSEADLQAMSGRLRYFNPQTSDELLVHLKAVEEVAIEHDVKLLILDSVASLARKEFSATNIRGRQAWLAKQSALLKYVGEAFRIPVVVTNHVTMRTAGTRAGFDFQSDVTSEESEVTAALGTAWAHCVNTRLVMEYADDGRCFRVAKSPLTPTNRSLRYDIGMAGVHESLQQMAATPMEGVTGPYDGSIATRSR